jgi:hydroxyacylglutathione hydrolase
MKKWVTSSRYTIYRILSGRSNVFLITNGTDNLLIDTSTKGDHRRLIKNLEALGCKQISLLILTHTHFDHVANASLIKERYNPKIIVHADEKNYIETGNTPLPQGTNAFTRLLINAFGRRSGSFTSYEPVKSDITIEDKFDLKDYGFNACIIHTPGHTHGSISVIVDGEIVIVGDAMFGMFKNSVFPPFADDLKAMVDSWRKLINTGCRTFLPSHGTEKGDMLLKSQYLKYKKEYS